MEMKECVSREMFVIGGAGTDPIRVRSERDPTSIPGGRKPERESLTWYGARDGERENQTSPGFWGGARDAGLKTNQEIQQYEAKSGFIFGLAFF